MVVVSCDTKPNFISKRSWIQYNSSEKPKVIYTNIFSKSIWQPIIIYRH